MKYAIPAFQGTRRSLATPRLVAADDIAVEIYYYGHQIPRSSVRYRAVDGIPPPDYRSIMRRYASERGCVHL